MKCRHYYYFGERAVRKTDGLTGGAELNEQYWDQLRTDSAPSPFAIENTSEAYVKNCLATNSYIEATKIILSVLEQNNLRKIVSLGIGKGILEWNIKNLKPEITIDCTDYTQKALEKLDRVWEKHDRFFPFDMKAGEYSDLAGYDSVLMYRVSTEFSKSEWITIFHRMADAGIQDIIFVPTEIATFSMMCRETLQHLKNNLRGRKDTFSGWLYTEDELLAFWKDGYDIRDQQQLGDTKIYHLKIKHLTGK